MESMCRDILNWAKMVRFVQDGVEKHLEKEKYAADYQYFLIYSHF